MSRIAKKPIIVPNNVNVVIKESMITVSSNSKKISYSFHTTVVIKYHENKLFFETNSNQQHGWMHAGTTRALVNSMILGVTLGFSKKLQLVGVGYKMNIDKNNVLNLFLGYSHVIKYCIPDNIVVTNISSTEITLTSFNKQLLGQVAANLRAKRKPEVYKGKGIRYFNEFIRIKEAKKK